MNTIRIGSRESKLAVIQSEPVSYTHLIRCQHPGHYRLTFPGYPAGSRRADYLRSKHIFHGCRRPVCLLRSLPSLQKSQCKSKSQRLFSSHFGRSVYLLCNRYPDGFRSPQMCIRDSPSSINLANSFAK